MQKSLILISILVLSSLGLAQNYQIDQSFVNHLQAGMVSEQDVYIEHEGVKGVFRVTADDTDMNAMLYGTLRNNRHDPGNPDANGPYGKGAALDLSLGDWLAATGEVSVSCTDGVAVVNANFQNLVPNGVYTLWYSTISLPPTSPITALDLPLGPTDGSQSTLTVDENGNSLYTLEYEPCIRLSTDQLGTMLILAYHSDGRTYGLSPGLFSYNSHIQLYTFLPTSADLAGN